MKKHQKLLSCFMIAAFCVSGLLLSGCKAKIKKHNLALASSAVVNTMMVTNPMGAMFGNDGDPGATADTDEIQTATALTGCPSIRFQLDIMKPLFYQTITITYAPDCLVNGVAMSGTVTGSWQLKLDDGVYIESTLTIDNLKVEGLTTDGSIHQKLVFEAGKSLSRLNGDMTTTHFDGRTRGIVFDNLTAEASIADFLEDLLGGSSELSIPSLVINGNATYNDEDDNTYTMDFTDVTQQFTCDMPTSGELHLVNTAEGFDALINYGDGTCDTLVTITLAGEEPEVVDITEYLKNRRRQN